MTEKRLLGAPQGPRIGPKKVKKATRAKQAKEAKKTKKPKKPKKGTTTKKNRARNLCKESVQRTNGVIRVSCYEESL